MLKKTLFLLSALCCLSLSSAQAENWSHVVTTEQGPLSVYVDTDNIKRKEDTATVWTKLVLRGKTNVILQ